MIDQPRSHEFGGALVRTHSGAVLRYPIGVGHERGLLEAAVRSVTELAERAGARRAPWARVAGGMTTGGVFTHAFIRANPVADEPVCGMHGDCGPDGVPHSLIAVDDRLYVVETNHNSILRVDPRTGAITRLHDLPVQDPAPITLIRHGFRFLLGGLNGLIKTFGDRFDRLLGREPDGSRTLLAAGLNFPIDPAHSHGQRDPNGLDVMTVSHAKGRSRGSGTIARVQPGRHAESRRFAGGGSE